MKQFRVVTFYSRNKDREDLEAFLNGQYKGDAAQPKASEFNGVQDDEIIESMFESVVSSGNAKFTLILRKLEAFPTVSNDGQDLTRAAADALPKKLKDFEIEV